MAISLGFTLVFGSNISWSSWDKEEEHCVHASLEESTVENTSIGSNYTCKIERGAGVYKLRTTAEEPSLEIHRAHMAPGPRGPPPGRNGIPRRADAREEGSKGAHVDPEQLASPRQQQSRNSNNNYPGEGPNHMQLRVRQSRFDEREGTLYAAANRLRGVPKWVRRAHASAASEGFGGALMGPRTARG
eukprot:3033337-Pyramimonas_sp.AAC.1